MEVGSSHQVAKAIGASASASESRSCILIEIVFNAITVLKFFIIFEQQALHFILHWAPQITQLACCGGSTLASGLDKAPLLTFHGLPAQQHKTSRAEARECSPGSWDLVA